jgi:hypothetical protein
MTNNMNLKTLIYDCEIVNAIPGKEPKHPNITYCQGWTDYAGMGISVITAYSYPEDRYHVFLQDNLAEFQTLVQAHTEIVGFNSVSFDDNLCAAHGIIVKSTYDLLRESYRAMGLAPFPAQYTAAYGGCGLDAICQATLGLQKTGHGELAPGQWQRRKSGRVIDYCLNDTTLTKKLFDRVVAGLPLINPKTKQPITLRL